MLAALLVISLALAGDAPALVVAAQEGGDEDPDEGDARRPRASERTGSLDPALRRWTRTGPCSPMDLLLTLPEPDTALNLSRSVGFGAGHFYAGRPRTGAVFAFAEGVPFALGTYAAVERAQGDEGATGLAVAGLGVFLVARVVDMALAPRSALETRREALADCDW